MAYGQVRTISYRKPYSGPTRRSKLSWKASQMLARRMGGIPRAPLATRGFYGIYSKRGRSELKYVDVDNVPAAVGATGGVVLQNGIAQGAGVNERVGRQVQNKSIFMRFGFYPSTTVPAPQGTIVRCIVFFDSQTNSAASPPAVGDVLEQSTWDSPMNLNNRERFKILIEFKVAIAATDYATGSLVAGSPVPRVIEKYRKLNMTSTYSGVGTGTSSISTGSICLLLLANVNNSVIADSYCRIRYTDC